MMIPFIYVSIRHKKRLRKAKSDADAAKKIIKEKAQTINSAIEELGEILSYVESPKNANETIEYIVSKLESFKNRLSKVKLTIIDKFDNKVDQEILTNDIILVYKYFSNPKHKTILFDIPKILESWRDGNRTGLSEEKKAEYIEGVKFDVVADQSMKSLVEILGIEFVQIQANLVVNRKCVRRINNKKNHVCIFNPDKPEKKINVEITRAFRSELKKLFPDD